MISVVGGPAEARRDQTAIRPRSRRGQLEGSWRERGGSSKGRSKGRSKGARGSSRELKGELKGEVGGAQRGGQRGGRGSSCDWWWAHARLGHAASRRLGADPDGWAQTARS